LPESFVLFRESISGEPLRHRAGTALTPRRHRAGAGAVPPEAARLL
jgi:hypothetical protein